MKGSSEVEKKENNEKWKRRAEWMSEGWKEERKRVQEEGEEGSEKWDREEGKQWEVKEMSRVNERGVKREEENSAKCD